MTILRALFLLLLVSFPAAAVDQITGIITLTNNPVGNTNTITINGSTRTWTNSIVASPQTLIKETNSVTIATTNLLNHLSLYPPVAGQILGQTVSTNVFIRALPGRALTITVAGGWAGITYTTNAVTSATIVRVPITVEAATNQTNIASLLVDALNLSTNAFTTNANAMTNFITKGAVVGPQHITSELRLSGNLNNGTGRLSVSNLLNYGAAIRSEGSGGNSFQVGSNAQALGNLSLAAGNGAVANGLRSLSVGVNAVSTNGDNIAVGYAAEAYTNRVTAIGSSALAKEDSDTAIGYVAVVSGPFSVGLGSQLSVTGTNSVGIGYGVNVDGDYASAFGPASGSSYYGSTAVGFSAATTTTNQIRLGTADDTVSIPGVLIISGTQTNTTFQGTNVINGRIDFTAGARSSLANGYNSGTTLGTNTYFRLSGPTAAYTNAGFAAAVDGTWHKLQFDNPGLSYTILDNSGLEATAANRVYTGTGALLNSTNNPVFAELIYDGSASRWRVISFR